MNDSGGESPGESQSESKVMHGSLHTETDVKNVELSYKFSFWRWEEVKQGKYLGCKLFLD